MINIYIFIILVKGKIEKFNANIYTVDTDNVSVGADYLTDSTTLHIISADGGIIDSNIMIDGANNDVVGIVSNFEGDNTTAVGTNIFTVDTNIVTCGTNIMVDGTDTDRRGGGSFGEGGNMLWG